MESCGSKKNDFKLSKKFNALVGPVTVNLDQWLLVKPQTFMNDSGRAVRAILEYYRLTPESDLILVHDDLDLTFGTFKVSRNKRPRDHNGVNSVLNTIGQGGLLGVRLGIAGETYNIVKMSGQSMADAYVLKPFTQDEQTQLPLIFKSVWEAAETRGILR